ncbi:hypothetical protein AAFF_G00360160 [Aldrovandia affinis]|uniref:Uncharacterized protein n=1 Tax=Aldrovandia affinis TaxID=143900 RepID=A0AAD7SI63_9TELE|nr:hypothetical protein AAFF_G00360160 [Aldrovandia affinis]
MTVNQQHFVRPLVTVVTKVLALTVPRRIALPTGGGTRSARPHTRRPPHRSSTGSRQVNVAPDSLEGKRIKPEPAGCAPPPRPAPSPPTSATQ